MNKPSKDGIIFSLYQCKNCRTVQVAPIPDQDYLNKYYSNEYFTQRTDRGYDNYYSPEIRKELFRVWKLNIQDLAIDRFITEKSGIGRSLDIGCAAGYFVDYMRTRGFQAEGIEIADAPVAFAREKLGLKVYKEDFLSWDRNFEKKYDLITLWASIEHMRDPVSILKKIKKHLSPGGRVLISTCRWGILAKLQKTSWRFLNVPEHIFYFSYPGLIRLGRESGLEFVKGISYGSGLTAKKESSFFYDSAKFFFDRLVKWTNQGDMMAIHFQN